MASSLQFFDRELSLAMTDLDPAMMQKELAAFARRSVAEVISSGQAPAEYEKFVNGRQGAQEESVVLPGPIIYLFSNWKLAIVTALEDLRRRVPKRSGRYAGSYVVLVNQKVVTSYDNIPADAEVTIFNAQPYTRRLETKNAGRRTAKYFNATKNTLNSRFSGVFQAQVMFLNVASGVAPGVPYVLKRSAGRRKDRAAGQPITYPAIILSPA